jgi:hypothetical protein
VFAVLTMPRNVTGRGFGSSRLGRKVTCDGRGGIWMLWGVIEEVIEELIHNSPDGRSRKMCVFREEFIELNRIFMTPLKPATSERSLPGEQRWRELYRAALFEKDRTRLPQRIFEARAAITVERRSLLTTGNDIRERQILDNALFSLGALKLCLTIALSSPRGSTVS